MRAKVATVGRVYCIECPYCGGSLVQDGSQMSILEDLQEGQLLTCCDCLQKARVPQLVIKQKRA